MNIPAHRITVTLLGLTVLLATLTLWMFRPARTVQVGYIGSLSGKYAALGTSARNGAILAQEELNSVGNHGQYRYELSIHDDQGNPELAVKALRELEKKGVRIIIGPFLSSCGQAVCEALGPDGPLVISPTVATQAVEGRDDRFIKMYPGTGDIGRILARHTSKTLGLRTAVVIFDNRNRAYGEPLADAFTGEFTAAGGRVAEVIAFDELYGQSGQEIADRALSANPETVVLACAALDTARLCQIFRQRSPDPRLLSATWGISEELLENGGAAIEGLDFFLPYDISSATHEYSRFVAAFRNRFGVPPTHTSVMNYDTLRLLDVCVRQSGDSPGAILMRILTGGSFNGLQGDYTFSRTGDAVWPLHLHTIKNGGIIRVR